MMHPFNPPLHLASHVCVSAGDMQENPVSLGDLRVKGPVLFDGGRAATASLLPLFYINNGVEMLALIYRLQHVLAPVFLKGVAVIRKYCDS